MLLNIGPDVKSVALEGRHLVIEVFLDEKRKVTEKHAVPLCRVDRACFIGNASVSMPAWRAFANFDIPVTLLALNNRYIGTFNSTCVRDSERKRMQFSMTPEKNLLAAKLLIENKICNQRRTILNFALFDGLRDNSVIAAAAERLKKIQGLLRKCKNAENLRGAEGIASAVYFRALCQTLPQEWRFSSRKANPPGDPCNAMLSFAYVLAAGELTGRIFAHGLEPSAGIFHRSMKNALAYDLIEPYRAPVCDTAVAVMIRRRIIKITDFVINADSGGVRMKDAARKKFLHHWENKRQSVACSGGKTAPLAEFFDRDIMALCRYFKSGKIPVFFKAK